MSGTTNTTVVQSELGKAVLATIQSCEFIKKGDTHKHGNYNYVSIDDYYEKCAKVAAANGLWWVPSEEKIDVVAGEKRDTILFTYNFTLYHTSGETLPGIKMTIPQPVQGPQTTGSALSFAEKDFMRILFKVVTGEEDAEAGQEQPQSIGAKEATYINEGQRQDLEALIQETATDQAKLLQHFKLESLDKVPATYLPTIIAALEKKRG